MATTLQFRRYDTSTIAGLVGESGELFINLDNGRIHVQDGVTAGGIQLSLKSEIDGKSDIGHTHGIGEITNLSTSLNAKANDSEVVKLTGDQTIAGEKTFSEQTHIEREIPEGFVGTQFLTLKNSVTDVTLATFSAGEDPPIAIPGMGFALADDFSYADVEIATIGGPRKDGSLITRSRGDARYVGLEGNQTIQGLKTFDANEFTVELGGDVGLSIDNANFRYKIGDTVVGNNGHHIDIDDNVEERISFKREATELGYFDESGLYLGSNPTDVQTQIDTIESYTKDLWVLGTQFDDKFLYRQRLPYPFSTSILAVNPLSIVLDSEIYSLTTLNILSLNDSGSWDQGSAFALTMSTPANRAGLDIYIVAKKPASGTTPELYLTPNSTGLSGVSAAEQMIIGGFHCLGTDVGTISLHPLNGRVAGDILPASIWDLEHRSSGEQSGTVYDQQTNLWVDIYLNSWTGSELTSEYGAPFATGATTPGFHWYNYVELFGEVGKRLPIKEEFLKFSRGSNQGTSFSGGINPTNTGSNSDTAGRRMISDIGIEDCCGSVLQWGLCSASTGVGGTLAQDTTGIATSYDAINSITRGYATDFPDRLCLGGVYSGTGSGVQAGSAYSVPQDPRRLIDFISARGVAKPKYNTNDY